MYVTESGKSSVLSGDKREAELWKMSCLASTYSILNFHKSERAYLYFCAILKFN